MIKDGTKLWKLLAASPTKMDMKLQTEGLELVMKQELEGVRADLNKILIREDSLEQSNEVHTEIRRYAE